MSKQIVKQKPSCIKLGIALDYPVKWNFQRIIRDFVQNFYDAAGSKEFENSVDYVVAEDDETLTLSIDSVGNDFGYEWLVYIGGSTKTGVNGKYVGEYGEGFKLAVLCTLRDYGYDITMESREWMIKPYIYTETVDGVKNKMLGYKKYVRDNDGHTRLVISGINRKYSSVLSEGKLSFYYSENPLFGQCLYRRNDIAIYERSDMDIPCEDDDGELKGILYYKYLARGRLPFPLIICVNIPEHTHTYHTYEKQDPRDRNTFANRMTVEIVSTEMENLPARASFNVLCRLKKYWNKLPDRLYDEESWYYFICTLVRNVASDDYYKKRFMKKYNNLVYIERPTPDKIQKRLVSQTEEWWRDNDKEGKRRVIPVFRLLGASNLIKQYEEEIRKNFIEPSEKEQKRYDIVMNIACICEKIDSDNVPKLLIYDGKNDYFNPGLFAKRTYKKCKAKNVLVPKYQIEYVVMTHTDFEDDNFDSTYVRAVDIILRKFGTEKSEKVNSLLTEAGAHIVKNKDIINDYRIRWESVTC